MSEALQEFPVLFAAAVFCARVIDVSMATVRTILLIRGHRLPAAAIGFFEVLVWLTAVTVVMRNLNAWYLFLAYAGGFSMGNVVGSWLESKLAMGHELVRAISANRDVALAGALRERGHSVTELEGRGDAAGPVEVLLVVERRRKVPGLLQLIEDTDHDAVCTLSDVRHARRTGGRAGFAGWRGQRKRK